MKCLIGYAQSEAGMFGEGPSGAEVTHRDELGRLREPWWLDSVDG